MNAKVFNLRPANSVATVANVRVVHAKAKVFQIRPKVKAAMNKQDVLASIKTAMLNYPDFNASAISESDFSVISPASNGQVLSKPLVFLFKTKTPVQKDFFFAFARLLERNELGLHLKYRVRFLTQKTDVCSIKLFTGTGDVAELLGVESSVEQ